MSIDGAPRIHEHWLVVSLQLDVQVLDADQRLQQEQCFVSLVLECATQLPMSFLVTQSQPNEADIQLCLYQAIWQPGNWGWLLRGLPEHVLLDTSVRIKEYASLQEALSWLIADVSCANSAHSLKNFSWAKNWLGDLQQRFAPSGPRNHKVRQRHTLDQLSEHIQRWLVEHCFEHHINDPVSNSLRRQGFVMPGFQTHPAGLFLPITGHVETGHNVVSDGIFRYDHPEFQCEPGEILTKRSLPTRKLGVKPFIFVRYNGLEYYLQL